MSNISNDEIQQIIPQPLKEILINLDVISQIKKGQKLNVRTKDFSEGDSWYDYCRRRLTRETKESSVSFVENSIEEGIKAMKNYNEFKELISEYLENSVGGIETMEEGYSRFPALLGRLGIAKKNVENI